MVHTQMLKSNSRTFQGPYISVTSKIHYHTTAYGIQLRLDFKGFHKPSYRK